MHLPKLCTSPVLIGQDFWYCAECSVWIIVMASRLPLVLVFGVNPSSISSLSVILLQLFCIYPLSLSCLASCLFSNFILFSMLPSLPGLPESSFKNNLYHEWQQNFTICASVEMITWFSLQSVNIANFINIFPDIKHSCILGKILLLTQCKIKIAIYFNTFNFFLNESLPSPTPSLFIFVTWFTCCSSYIVV